MTTKRQLAMVAIYGNDLDEWYDTGLIRIMQHWAEPPRHFFWWICDCCNKECSYNIAI